MSLVGAAAIGAGASLLSNVFGKKSQDSANNANLKIAQMNNEWSERMMQKQMDYNSQQWEKEKAYNTEMWNKTNEYNSAANQAKRLKEAGLNPALVMSGSNAGTASAVSAPSGNSVGLPSPTSASVSPYRYDFSGIGSSLAQAYAIDGQLKVNDSQARFLDKQADWYSAKALADISKAMAETDSHTAKTFYQQIQNSMAKDMLGADYINKIRQNQSLEVQIQNSIKQGVLMDKQISRYDEQTNAQIADLVASTALKYSQGQLNKEQLKKVIMDTKGLNLSNREKEAIFDYVVERARIDANPQSATQWFNSLFGNRFSEWQEKMKWKPVKLK